MAEASPPSGPSTETAESWPISRAGSNAALATAWSPSTCSARAPAATTTPTATSTSRWCSIRRRRGHSTRPGSSSTTPTIYARHRLLHPALGVGKGQPRRPDVPSEPADQPGGAPRGGPTRIHGSVGRCSARGSGSDDRGPSRPRARQAVQSARILLSAGDLNGAVNRAYYAMFYAAHAALAHQGIEVALLAKAWNFGRSVRRAFGQDQPLAAHPRYIPERRYLSCVTRADYSSAEVTLVDAERSLTEAEAFIAAVERLIRG